MSSLPPTAQRITKIRGRRWIHYAAAEAILAQLETVLSHPKMHRMPNVLLLGETNNGKTALMNRFVKRHSPQSHPHHTTSSIPVVAIQAPPIPDERRLYQSILKQFFAPFRPSHPAGHLQHEVFNLLRTLKTKMLIIDEIHHVLAGPLLKQRHFLNVVKYLGNELQIPIVAVGTPDAFHAIHTDPQLANRFEPATLPRWKMDEEYLRLLASFELAFALKEPSHLTDMTLATKILSLSGGTIGEIGALLCRAALLAIDRGTERITKTMLDECGYISPAERRRVASTI